MSNHGYHSFLYIWTDTVLNCYCFEPLLSWTVTVINYYYFCFWTVTVLNSYCIELLLFLNRYCIELLLFCFWTVTILNCYCIEMLLFWTVIVLNCYCFVFEPLLSWIVTVLNFYCFVFEPLLSSEVAFWPHLRFLTIFRVLELCFKWDWSRCKAKTWAYKSFERRRTQFYPQDSQNFSSTNQSYCLIESVMTQSRLVTHNWSSPAPNWARAISLVS